jgi:hypothetical protein
MGIDGRSQRVFPKPWTGLTAAGNSQTTAFLLDNGVYHEFTTVGSGQGCVLPVPVELPREITISNNGGHALLVYPQVGGTIDNGSANAAVSVAAGSSVTYWPTSFTNWQSRVTGGSGGGGGGTGTITEVSQTTGFTAAAGAFYLVSGSSNITATLPTAVGIAGQTVRIRCASGYTGKCTIATTGGQTLGPASATTQIIYAGESALLQSDGTNWVRTGGTIIPCSCRLTLGTGQSITNSTQPTVQLNTVEMDNSGLMSGTAASSYQITIFRPGRYLLTGSAYFGALTSGQTYNIQIQIQKNAAGISIANQLAVPSTASTASIELNITALVPLAAGDLITLNCLQINAGSNAETLSAGEVTSLQAVEIPSW